MQAALQQFYYFFNTQQHYFLCHDILEEAWKENPNYSKEDAVVSLILFATGCYHHRRNNFKGARKSFNKAKRVIQQHRHPQLGLLIDHYIRLIDQLLDLAEEAQPFIPVELPMTEEMKQQVIERYPDYQFTKVMTEDRYIIDHHLLRDRRAVLEARLQALNDKHKNHR